MIIIINKKHFFLSTKLVAHITRSLDHRLISIITIQRAVLSCGIDTHHRNEYVHGNYTANDKSPPLQSSDWSYPCHITALQWIRFVYNQHSFLHTPKGQLNSYMWSMVISSQWGVWAMTTFGTAVRVIFILTLLRPTVITIRLNKIKYFIQCQIQYFPSGEKAIPTRNVSW